MRLRRALLSAFAALGLALPAAAESAPTPEQVALVTEFLQVTEVDGGAQALRQAFVGQAQQTYPQTFEEMLAEMSLSDDEVAAARAGYRKSLVRFRTRFGELFDEQIDLEVLARVLYAPIYMRHFSEDELRALIAFYRTPAGAKSLRVLPAAMTDVAREVVPAMAPLISSLVNEAVAAEKAALAEAIRDR